MSSPATPFIDLDPESLSPDSTDFFVFGESPIKPGHQANEYLTASTITMAQHHTSTLTPAVEGTQRTQDANHYPTHSISQGDASPATPVVHIDPGSSSPTEVDDDASLKFRNDSSIQITEHLHSAFSAIPPDRNLLTPTISEGQQSMDAFPFTPVSSQRTTSRPGSTPRCMSPSLASRRSMNSSERNRSMESYSSSEYLTTPIFQPDCDNPPFVPLHGDRNSLTMMDLRRVKTIPAGDEYSLKLEGTRKRRSRFKKKKMSKNEYQPFWHRSECLTAPTAPPGMQNLCLGHIDEWNGIHTRGNTYPYGRPHPTTTRSTTSFPRIVRRWSSVEIGAHQMPLASSVPVRASRSSFTMDTAINAFLPTIDLGQRARSSITGAIDHGILETVRQRLTYREIEQLLPEIEQLLPETPISITLSRPRMRPPINHLMDLQIFKPQDKPTIRQHVAPLPRKTSLAYLITTKDIESITDLIATNIEAKYINEGKHTLSRSKSTMFDLPVTSKDEKTVQTIDTKSEYLQISPNKQMLGSTSRRESFNSTEMIWQNSPSPRVDESFFEDGSRALAKSGSSPGTSERQASDLTTDLKQKEVSAFDPQNARASITNWQNDISLVDTSSDDDRCTGLCTVADEPAVPLETNDKERQKHRPFLGYRSSANAVQGIESFPPPPQRKLTSDWHSPLPEMETIYPRAPCSEISPSRQITPKASQMPWARSAQLSPTQVTPGMSMDFNWNDDAAVNSSEHLSPNSHHDAFPLEETRRNSVVKFHPSATPRVGSATSIGSSLGASSHVRIRSTRPPPPDDTKAVIFPSDAPTLVGLQVPSSERRTSSSPPIRRVRTIDNAQKGEHRAGCSKWRAPSVCPLPQSPSLSEFEFTSPLGYFESSLSSGTMPVSSPSHLERIRRVFHQKMNATRDTCPPSVKVDQVGIYGQMARVRSNISTKESDEQQGRKREDSHECDDVANYPERDRNLCID